MHTPADPSDVRATVAQVSAESAADSVVPFPLIAGYRFQKRLGQGGMATVYLAMQESLDRPVSIKVMEREALQDEISKQRFENEARTIAQLTHPGIVGIHEVGRTGDGRMYYIMPYLSNGDLSQRDLRDDETRIVELLRVLLSALGYAHARGIVHRDVKMENVLFDANNRPLLADFGIALSKRDSVRITTAGLAVGSSGYMAPEQARGEEVDGRADLYSVGVLAFELLTGELPFQSPDALALALMHAQDAIPRLPPAKRHWQGFIDRAMTKSPSRRYENAQQMLQALDRIDRRSGSHLSNRLLRTLDRTLESNRWKRPRLLALGCALLLAAGLFVARTWMPSAAVSVSTPAQSAAAAPAVPATPTPANAAVAPTPASSQPATVPPDDPSHAQPAAASEQPPAAHSAKRPKHTARHPPVKKRGWIWRMLHRK